MLDIAGQPVHVIDRGTGPPVVFLHAFPLQAAMWDYQLEAFEPTNRCVAIDFPGFGGSPGPKDPAAATVDGWADLVAGVIDELGLEAPTVVASSMGGYVAMALVRRHRDRVGQVVFAGTRAKSDDSATADRRWEQLTELRSGADLEPMGKSLVENLLASGSLARDDLVTYVRSLADGATREGWIAALEAMRKRPDAMLTLRQSDVPGHVVVGELDRITPIADATLIRSLLGSAELVVLPSVAHLPNLEDPLAFNAAIAPFLGVELAADEPAPEAAEEPDPAS